MSLARPISPEQISFAEATLRVVRAEARLKTASATEDFSAYTAAKAELEVAEQMYNAVAATYLKSK